MMRVFIIASLYPEEVLYPLRDLVVGHGFVCGYGLARKYTLLLWKV